MVQNSTLSRRDEAGLSRKNPAYSCREQVDEPVARPARVGKGNPVQASARTEKDDWNRDEIVSPGNRHLPENGMNCVSFM